MRHSDFLSRRRLPILCTDQLERIGVEVKYWGVPLTEVLTQGKKLLTV